MIPRDWYDPDGRLLVTRHADGTVIEYRRPPYVQLWPCPWCDAPTAGEGHEVTQHIDTHLRTKVMP